MKIRDAKYLMGNDMTKKFQEGQQIWVCANIGGQLVREKSVVLGVTADEIMARSFGTVANKHKNMAEYRLNPDGRGENVWLEPRL